MCAKDCLASRMILTLRSWARMQILFKSSYSSFRSATSCVVGGGTSGIRPCRAVKSDGSEIPENGTGGLDARWVRVKWRDEFRSASPFGRRAV